MYCLYYLSHVLLFMSHSFFILKLKSLVTHITKSHLQSLVIHYTDFPRTHNVLSAPSLITILNPLSNILIVYLTHILHFVDSFILNHLSLTMRICSEFTVFQAFLHLHHPSLNWLPVRVSCHKGDHVRHLNEQWKWSRYIVTSSRCVDRCFNGSAYSCLP